MKLGLSILDDCFTIHRFSPNTRIPSEVCDSRFYSICKTHDELSVVCDSRLTLKSEKRETGWRIIKVSGPLDFSLTGILAGIATSLAAAEIPIFAVSTSDTDYILVKKENLKRAQAILEGAGCQFV